MSGVLHGVAMKKPYVCYMVAGDDIISGEMAGKWTVKDTKINRNLVLEIQSNNTGSVEDVNEVAQKRER